MINSEETNFYFHRFIHRKKNVIADGKFLSKFQVKPIVF